jgi:hypothetical protein
MHGLACDGLRRDLYAQIEAELEQQFVEDVLSASISVDVFNVIE